MSDTDCFFEYPSRWQQLYEAFLSQDEGQLQQAVAQLEERDIALEDHLRNRPCGGGGGCTNVYGFAGDVDLDVEDVFWWDYVTLTEQSTVTVTATANVQRKTPGPEGDISMGPWVSWQPALLGPVSWLLLAHSGDTCDAFPARHGALTYVITLPAGTYELGVRFWGAITDCEARVSTSIVVGCDTGADSTWVGG